MASSSGRLVHFRAYFDRFFTISLYIFFVPYTVPRLPAGLSVLPERGSTAEGPGDADLCRAECPAGWQLGHLAPSVRAFVQLETREGAARLRRHPEAELGTLASNHPGRHRHAISLLFPSFLFSSFFFTSNSSSSKPFRIYLYDGLCLRWCALLSFVLPPLIWSIFLSLSLSLSPTTTTRTTRKPRSVRVRPSVEWSPDRPSPVYI